MDILKMIFFSLVFPGGIFLILISLFASGIDRKLVSRMQRRIGPPIIQPFYDFIKLLSKEVIVPKNAIRKVFLLAPVIGVVSVIIVPIFIPIFNNTFIQNESDIIFIIYLLTISNIALIVAGSSSSSTYGSIGASREGVLLLSLEIPLVIAILSVCKFSGNVLSIESIFSIEGIINAQNINGNFLKEVYLIPAAFAFLCVIPGESSVVPFDIAESETEICEGPLVEYSGIYLGISKLTQNIKAFIMSALFVSLFLGGNSFNNLILDTILFVILSFIVMFISNTVVRSIFARIKINQALRFYIMIPTIFAVLSLILVNYF